MDEHSDLDLILAVEPASFDVVMRERMSIARSYGSLLAAFTGEHVREPRLLICLYGPPLAHVDLKFVRLDDLETRVEEPVVLFDRAGRLARALRAGAARYPHPDPQWIEDRFWIWVHYAASRIARGELFEALDFLSSLRQMVLGPLALERAGAQPNGVRRIERAAPDFARELETTVAAYDARDCARAVHAAIELYRSLRRPGLTRSPDAEREAVAFLAGVARALPPV